MAYFLAPWPKVDIPTWIHPKDDRNITRKGLGFPALPEKKSFEMYKIFALGFASNSLSASALKRARG